MNNVTRLNTNVLDATFDKITKLQGLLSVGKRRATAKGEIVDDAVDLYYDLLLEDEKKRFE